MSGFSGVVMPQILVLHGMSHVDDRIDVEEDDLAETVTDLYDKLNSDYSIEILYDDDSRAIDQ
jgi:hypothetical protein